MWVRDDGHTWNNNNGQDYDNECADTNMNDPSEWEEPNSGHIWVYTWNNFYRYSDLEVDIKEEDPSPNADDDMHLADQSLDFDWPLAFLTSTTRYLTGYSKLLSDDGGNRYITVSGVSVTLFYYRENYKIFGIDIDHGFTVKLKIANIRGL